jgi:hypothetical protein
MPLITCPDCRSSISDAAPACPHCGRPIAHASSYYAPAQTVVVQQPSNGIAAVLSLIIPGAGQMYKGHIGGGLAWLIFTFIGYLLFIIPGLLLHLCCIIDAASSRPR